MSIPLVDLVWLLISTFLGRAMAIINELNANNRNTNKNGFSLANNDFCALKPLTELIFNVGDCCFLFHNCHKTTAGSNKNNQKNSGFKKLTSFIVLLFVIRLSSTFFQQFVVRIYRLHDALPL